MDPYTVQKLKRSKKSGNILTINFRKYILFLDFKEYQFDKKDENNILVNCEAVNNSINNNIDQHSIMVYILTEFNYFH